MVTIKPSEEVIDFFILFVVCSCMFFGDYKFPNTNYGQSKLNTIISLEYGISQFLKNVFTDYRKIAVDFTL
jgi:hypothetical protein